MQNLADKEADAGRKMIGLLGTSFYKEIKPYIKKERYVREGGGTRNARNRIEIRTLPPDLLKRALDFEMPCVACGAIHHPFRRRGPAKRGENIGHLYFAACCPLKIRMGCSRSKAASEEYKRVVAAA